MERLIRKNWAGINTRLSSQEKMAEGRRIKGLMATPGDATKGHALFTQRCAACHTLFDQGGKIGPALHRLRSEQSGFLAGRDSRSERRNPRGLQARTPRNSRTARRSWACSSSRTRPMSCCRICRAKSTPRARARWRNSRRFRSHSCRKVSSRD